MLGETKKCDRNWYKRGTGKQKMHGAVFRRWKVLKCHKCKEEKEKVKWMNRERERQESVCVCVYVLKKSCWKYETEMGLKRIQQWLFMWFTYQMMIVYVTYVPNDDCLCDLLTKWWLFMWFMYRVNKILVQTIAQFLNPRSDLVKVNCLSTSTWKQRLKHFQ